MYLAELLGVAPSTLENRGILNLQLDVDNRYYLSPRLLQITDVPELAGGHDKVIARFGKVIKLLPAVRQGSNQAKAAARGLLSFPEPNETRLGLSNDAVQGRGVGEVGGDEFLENALDVYGLGIDDPEILEFMFLFGEHIGADKISDMCTRILEKELIAFTERQLDELGIDLRANHPEGLNVARCDNLDVWFVPTQVLRPFAAGLWHHVLDDACSTNQDLRKHINQAIFQDKAPSKHKLVDALDKDSKFRMDMFSAYKDSKPESVKDKGASRNDTFVNLAQEVSTSFDPNKTGSPASSREWAEFVMNHVRDRCDANMIPKMVADQKDRGQGERTAQRFIMEIAKGMTRMLHAFGTKGYAINGEVNDGPGPCDFLFTGPDGQCAVEVKLSDNDWTHGAAKQLPAYMKAIQTTDGILVVFSVNGTKETDQDVEAACQHASQETGWAITGFRIDGNVKPSASKL